MSQLVGLPNNSYKPMTNTAWVRAWLCKLQKGCTRLTPASDKVRRWFSPGTPSSSTTKTGRHDINLKHNQSIYGFYLPLWYLQTFLMTSFIPRIMHVQISKLGFFFISTRWYNVRMVTLTEYLFTLLHCVVLSITACPANRKSTVHNDNLSF